LGLHPRELVEHLAFVEATFFDGLFYFTKTILNARHIIFNDGNISPHSTPCS